MEDNSKKYWKGIEELSNDSNFVKFAQNEFPEYLPVKESTPNKSTIPSDVTGGSNRRDFLKLMGFGLAAASLASCEAPVRKAIPFLNKPEEIDPGIPNYYASTYYDTSGDYSSILVKTREGRPIKIQPNTLSTLTPVGTSTRAQAALLSLYDIERLRGPKHANKNVTWEYIDEKITAQLQQIASQGGAIRLVSSTIISPTTKKVIQDFIAKYPTTQHVVYDANSVFGIIQANQASFGKAVVPSYDFSKPEVIVGIGQADFLGTWLFSTANGYQYIQTRRLNKNKKDMSRHYQFETTLTLTGSNADYRTPIKPSQEGLVVANLYNKLAKMAGAATVNVPEVNITYLDQAASDLFKARGKAVVLCGSNDVNVQVMVNAINSLLNAYGTIIDLNNPLYLKQGNDIAMANFVQDVQNGRVSAVIFYHANPVYNYPAGGAFAESLKKVPLKVSFADRVDETSGVCDYICPDNHFLESWNDAEPKRGSYSLVQPTISPLFKTRPAQESLLAWAGNNQEYYLYLQNNWRTNFYPLSGATAGGFDVFWTRSLHDGVFESKGGATATSSNANQAVTTPAPTVDLNTAVANIGKRYKATNNTIELSLYEKVAMGNGDQANNPWLQELHDPITKACWDNYLMIPATMSNDMNLKQGDMVSVSVNGKVVIDELPVLVQPGQAPGTVSVAVGYGREKAGKAANKVGKNAFPLATFEDGTVKYDRFDVKITPTGGFREIAQTQTHHTIMARPIVQEAKLAEYQVNPQAGRYLPKIATSVGPQKPGEITLWDEHSYTNHSWGMVIDLNSCIGCSACVVSCHIENNVPVVGRNEVINRRDMFWLRIDRYYSSDADPNDRSISGYEALEVASANPEVVFMPMLCQHCQNAPCETVCPVLATTHSFEGLNQMTYNRCIGTRYCANNCPYKVRRFNWFKYFNNDEFPYYMNNDLGKMVLNPDVTVRSRGVMEKCTFCVQRIQAGKLKAKIERRRPLDGEIVTACAEACPTQAITFGDLNNPDSQVARIREDEYEKRAYTVLEEINTKPQIAYLTKIRNKEVKNS